MPNKQIEGEKRTMTDLRVITTTGSEAILKEAAVQHFAAGLRGPLLRPDAP